MYENTIVSKNDIKICQYIWAHAFGMISIFIEDIHYSRVFSDVQIGDVVTIGECRPLCKTVRFNVLKVAKAAGSKKQFQKF